MLLTLLFACSPAVETDAPPPEGFLVVDGAHGSLAQCLAGFPESEAEKLAAEWSASPCAGSRTSAWGADGPGEAACAEPSPAVSAWRGDALVAFATPPGADGQVFGRVTARPEGGLHVEVRAPMPAKGSFLRLLVPGASPRESAILSDTHAAMHVRMRTAEGIDIAPMIPPDSQGAKLFGLNSALLGSAVLDGTWELAVYPPAEGGTMPRPVLGLGVRTLTVDAALDAFMEQVRSQWSIHRKPISAGAWKGECVSGLRLMPDFEPCYLREGDKLAIGWNQSAVELAAADSGREAASNGVALDLERLAESDAVLAASAPRSTLVAPIRYPLGRLELALRDNGGEQLVLEGNSTRGCAP